MSYIHYGEDYNYARSRLNGTVVKYEGVPTHVDDICVEGGAAYVSVLYGPKLGGRTVPSEDLDMSPIPLGLVNSQGQAHFCARVPTRHYRQGLSNANIRWYGRKFNINNPKLVKCMVGVYPKDIECAELLVNDEVKSAAFSRTWYLTTPRLVNGETAFRIGYKRRLVGFANLNEEFGQLNYELDDRYSYLDETLKKVLEKNG